MIVGTGSFDALMLNSPLYLPKAGIPLSLKSLIPTDGNIAKYASNNSG